MRIRTTLYFPAATPIHACDARVKIALLLAFTIAVFFVESWWGMLLCTVLVAVAVGVAKLPVKTLSFLMVPVALLALFSVVFNVTGALSNGMSVAEGLLSGAMVALRMLLLVAASFIVCFTTTSTELLTAFTRLLSQLRVLRVPVGDIALVLSMAVRFIPMIAEHYQQIQDAQASRGASFGAGPLLARIKAHGAIFIPLFVSLFRRADSIATAMDARCYGLAPAGSSIVATSLDEGARIRVSDVGALVAGVCLLAFLAVVA